MISFPRACTRRSKAGPRKSPLAGRGFVYGLAVLCVLRRRFFCRKFFGM